MDGKMSESQLIAAGQSQQDDVITILFVDDEANILSALKRLFRPFGYRIFTAESGAAGLEVMAHESVDLVVSDMRMPEMNGAQFLEKTRENWPDTVRILLTGYAEIGATIDAINKGRIYRYISKPWEDNDIILTVKQALDTKLLEREKNRLEALIRAQNEELKNLNATLEERVKARTEEVRQTMGFLEVSHDKLKKSFITSIRVFSNLIEMREGRMAGHSRRVADMARAIAQRMGMTDAEVQDIFLAALLHDVGKIGLSDRLIEKSFSSLTSEERTEVVKHPAKGEAALMALEQLHGAAKFIRGHHERFDGQGYPDKLAGLAIPLGARILAVANDYDSVQLGTILNKHLSQQEAIAYIQEGRSNRYDPAVVDAFLGKMAQIATDLPDPKPEMMLNSGQLQSGMKLSRDMMGGGNLLLSKDYVLDAQLIAQIKNFERLENQLFTIWIYAKKGG
ncbi:two-component system response regulator [Sulfuriferula nivalis]|uniref:Two-component system response regulator n=1 Tax=Sulfuriferula nivalis TaxID=2675298 RepID=A0A809S7R6_9PROT|nr:two-component system response regulator [Sulfuriferula nivalis]